MSGASHDRDGRPAQTGHGQEVDLEDPHPRFIGQLGDRAVLGRRVHGVVDEDGQGPEPVDDGVDELRRCVRRRQVCLDERRFAVDGGDHTDAPVRVASGDDHSSSLVREQPGDVSADAGGRPGD